MLGEAPLGRERVLFQEGSECVLGAAGTAGSAYEAPEAFGYICVGVPVDLDASPTDSLKFIG